MLNLFEPAQNIVVARLELAEAQQFNSDNQWTAPHGAATIIATIGEEYSASLAVAALRPGWNSTSA